MLGLGLGFITYQHLSYKIYLVDQPQTEKWQRTWGQHFQVKLTAVLLVTLFLCCTVWIFFVDFVECWIQVRACARMCEDLVVGNKLKIRIPFIVGVQQCVCVAVCAEYQRICDDSCLSSIIQPLNIFCRIIHFHMFWLIYSLLYMWFLERWHLLGLLTLVTALESFNNLSRKAIDGSALVNFNFFLQLWWLLNMHFLIFPPADDQSKVVHMSMESVAPEFAVQFSRYSPKIFEFFNRPQMMW